jgi:hypothetical protein
VARPRTLPTTISRAKPGTRSSRPASARDGAGRGSGAGPSFRCRGFPSTNSTSSATPTTATQKLTMNTESNASGAMASSPKATSGPSIAPVVSSAR